MSLKVVHFAVAFMMAFYCADAHAADSRYSYTDLQLKPGRAEFAAATSLRRHCQELEKKFVALKQILSPGTQEAEKALNQCVDEFNGKASSKISITAGLRSMVGGEYKRGKAAQTQSWNVSPSDPDRKLCRTCSTNFRLY